MDQHRVQEAYLKRFSCPDGRLWVYDKTTGRKGKRAPSRCTDEVDFQSSKLETMQNADVESPGIQAIRRIFDRRLEENDDLDRLMRWVNLHLVRNIRYATEEDASTMQEALSVEDALSECLTFVNTYTCKGEEFLITSDVPVVEVPASKSAMPMRLIAADPKTLISLSGDEDCIEHNALSLPNFFNTMMWSNSNTEIFSNQAELPISQYKENIEKYNLHPRRSVSTYAISDS